MIKRILIPTDGFGLEDHVIRYVARTFSFADFHVVSVVNTYERGVQLTDILYEEMKESAQKAISHAENLLEEEGIHLVHSAVLEGLPSREIVRYAKSHDVDLIAMRVYCRKSTASAHRLGSTVKNVLKRSTIPVLTLAEDVERYEIKRILLLTDGTLKSHRAENYAILLASSFGAALEILYIRGKEEGNIEGKLKNVSWKASYWGIPVETFIEEESMDKVIKHFHRSDVAVMGVGKRILFFKTVGRMSQLVATHSPIPVIFVSSMKKRWSQRMPRKA